MGFGRDVRAAIFTKVESFSQVEVNQFGPPSLITRNTNDVQQVQTVVFMGLTVIPSAPMMIIGGIILAVREDAADVPAAAGHPAAHGPRHRAHDAPRHPPVPGDAEKVDRINQVMRETLSGVRVIRAFVRTEHEEERFDVANQDLFGSAIRVNRLFAVTIPVLTLIMNGSTVAVMWFGAMRVEDGAMGIGNLTAFLQYLLLVMFSVLTVGAHVHPRAARRGLLGTHRGGARDGALHPRPGAADRAARRGDPGHGRVPGRGASAIRVPSSRC